MPLPKEIKEYYTEEDYYALPEGERVELINGVFYDMASPSQLHQEISGHLFRIIGNYIEEKGGKCKVFHAPFDVKLDEKRDTIVQPDISVICDRDKLDGKRCNGAPDWIIEIVSPSSATHDYVRKYNLYKNAKVKEYWQVNPDSKSVVVHRLVNGEYEFEEYSITDTVKPVIYDDLEIDFKDIMDKINS
ncbi:Uma2 family endonuclease [Butyrivibrio sp. AE3004]|uniref:Uma2 family endonuclease n=1 Tax=Butyrivibrio sp. AE3004 TaxID=1506994 RepID=UPI0004944901|nr:Uma2 family endonuclease [Butyrivibrio sp. AE3004]